MSVVFYCRPPIYPKSAIKVRQASTGSITTGPAGSLTSGASHVTSIAASPLTATNGTPASVASSHVPAEKPPRPRSTRLASLRQKALQREKASSSSDGDSDSGSSTNWLAPWLLISQNAKCYLRSLLSCRITDKNTGMATKSESLWRRKKWNLD